MWHQRPKTRQFDHHVMDSAEQRPPQSDSTTPTVPTASVEAAELTLKELQARVHTLCSACAQQKVFWHRIRVDMCTASNDIREAREDRTSSFDSIHSVERMLEQVQRKITYGKQVVQDVTK